MPDASPTPSQTAPTPITTAATQMIVFEKLHTSALNPRKHFDAAAIEELAASIAAQGLIENLVARPSAKTPGSFEILAGERRYRALKLLIERKTLPTGTAVPVQIRTLDDKAASLLALTENMARSDLTPIEEAEAFAKLEALGVKTAEMARQTGASQRFIQLRIALVKKLAPAAHKALAAGKITLEHARELVKVPVKRQESILDRIAPPGEEPFSYDIVTAEDLREALREDMVPVERAIFDRKLYKGEIIVIDGDGDEDKGGEFFADPDEFTKLQKAAVEAKKAAYKAAGAAFVDEPSYAPHDLKSLPYGWRKATAAEIAAKKTGVLVMVRNGEFRAHENVMREGDGRDEGRSSRTTASSSKSDKDEFPLGAAREALVVRTHALQAAVATDALHAKRCVVFALLTGDDLTVRLASRHLMVSDPEPSIAKTLDAFAKSGLRDDLNEVSAWSRIVDLTPPILDKLFAALVASCVSVENPNARDPGAAPVEIAMAETMKAELSRVLKIDAEFLAKLKKPQLLRMVADLKLANDVRLAQGPDAVTATVLRKIVLDAGPKLAGYVPPWCKFADAKAIAADLKRTPAIDPAPAKAAVAAIAKSPAAKPPAAKPAAKPAAPKPTAKKPAAKAKPAVKRGAKK
jgi:ParB/RepB/Spo0J family partition protein